MTAYHKEKGTQTKSIHMMEGNEKSKLYYKVILELGLHQLQEKTSAIFQQLFFKMINKFSCVTWMQVIVAIFRKSI